MTIHRTVFDLFAGPGKMRTLLRNKDWSTSPLGFPHTWPPELRTIVQLMLNSKFPMCIAWGHELGFLYNEAYAQFLDNKHPNALGRPFEDALPEIWSDIRPLVDKALAGESIYIEDMPVFMPRQGRNEQVWFTFSYSPVNDSTGAVTGMYCTITETTLAPRRRHAPWRHRQRREPCGRRQPMLRFRLV